MSAPVPPTSESPVDPLKQTGQFPGGYTQAFSSQPENKVDQSEIPQETLQSGEEIAWIVVHFLHTVHLAK